MKKQKQQKQANKKQTKKKTKKKKKTPLWVTRQDPDKYLDKQINADPDQMPCQKDAFHLGPHCLPFASHY